MVFRVEEKKKEKKMFWAIKKCFEFSLVVLSSRRGFCRYCFYETSVRRYHYMLLFMIIGIAKIDFFFFSFLLLQKLRPFWLIVEFFQIKIRNFLYLKLIYIFFFFLVTIERFLNNVIREIFLWGNFGAYFLLEKI